MYNSTKILIISVALSYSSYTCSAEQTWIEYAVKSPTAASSIRMTQSGTNDYIFTLSVNIAPFMTNLGGAVINVKCDYPGQWAAQASSWGQSLLAFPQTTSLSSVFTLKLDSGGSSYGGWRYLTGDTSMGVGRGGTCDSHIWDNVGTALYTFQGVSGTVTGTVSVSSSVSAGTYTSYIEAKLGLQRYLLQPPGSNVRSPYPPTYYLPYIIQSGNTLRIPVSIVITRPISPPASCTATGGEIKYGSVSALELSGKKASTNVSITCTGATKGTITLTGTDNQPTGVNEDLKNGVNARVSVSDQSRVQNLNLVTGLNSIPVVSTLNLTGQQIKPGKFSTSVIATISYE